MLVNTRKYIFLFTLVFLSSALILQADTGKDTVREEMARAYQSFSALQPYLVSEKRFSDPANEEQIMKLLKELSQDFSAAQEEKTKLSDQPGFSETLSLVTERLLDIEKRFAEGRKGYALWSLKTVGNYCIACHTTFSSDNSFVGGMAKLKGLSNVEKAEFHMATRQFSKAAEEFKLAVYSEKNPRERMYALRKWLMISIRVKQDPRVALKELDSMESRIKFSDSELEAIKDFRVSLRRWINEPKQEAPSLRRAENLIRQSLSMNDLLDNKQSTVELLRATAMLHGLLEGEPDKLNPDRARILYLLGLSYSKLPLFFVNELPEFFLELCIRENPNTNIARKCYRLHSSNTYLDFTGSGGTEVPADVQEQLNKLYRIAYGR